jgi:hypothetical protein
VCKTTHQGDEIAGPGRSGHLCKKRLPGPGGHPRRLARFALAGPATEVFAKSHATARNPSEKGVVECDVGAPSAPVQAADALSVEGWRRGIAHRGAGRVRGASGLSLCPCPDARA